MVVFAFSSNTVKMSLFSAMTDSLTPKKQQQQTHNTKVAIAITSPHIATLPLAESLRVCGRSPCILTHLFVFYTLGKKANHMAIIGNRWHLPNVNGGAYHCNLKHSTPRINCHLSQQILHYCSG